MPEPSLPAARRSACSRRGASRYAWPAVCGVVMGAAWSRAPAGVATVAGEPAAEPTTPKLASTDDCSTPDTAWRSELSCWGLARWAWGAVVLLQAAASTATTARPHRGRPGRAGMLVLRNVGGAGDVQGESAAAEWSSLKPTPRFGDRTVTGRTTPAERTNRLAGRRLRDHAAAEQPPVGVVQRAGLPRRDRPHGLGEIEYESVARARPHPARHGGSAVTALHECGVARRQRLGEPVHLGQFHGVAEQLVPGSDHHFTRFRSDRDHVHRLTESAGEAAALSDGVAREAGVHAHDLAAGRDERAGHERGGVHREMALEDADVVVIGDEADLDRFGLVGRDEPEPPGDRAGLALGERSHGREHARHDRAVDAPQEIRLVLLRVAAAEQRAVPGDGVVARRDVGALERVGVVEEGAKLGERIAAHARNGRAAAGVLAHEVRNHVATEPVLQVQHVVRDAEPVGHVPRVADRVERAAGPVGHRVAVAEQLHGGADDVVPRLHQQGCGDGRVHAPRHGNENALPHRWSTADSCLTFSTIFGSAPITASTSSAVFSLPNEKRSAATPSSGGTPIAVSTCDGSTAPVLQAEPEEQAIPARSRCINSASLSVPGRDTLDTCGARGARAAWTTASGTTASTRRSSSSRSAAARAAKSACSRAASSTAFPSPMMPGTFSVPGRMPNCWPPPWMMASTACRSRTISAPTPLGAPILWPEIVSKVQPASASETGILPSAWTASTWSGTPAARQRAATRATGCTTPTSLFTHITLTTATPRASAAASASSATAPDASTGRMISSPPSRATACAAARTALCSIADTATRNGPPRARAASAHPITARLSASVPPDVKITWPGSAPPPSAVAIVRLASSMPARAARPYRCAEDGLPKASRPR